MMNQMTDKEYEKEIENLMRKHRHVSANVLRLSFKISHKEANRLHKLFILNKKDKEIFCEKNEKTLVQKHNCNAISVAYLQKRLKLDFEETEIFLDEWKNIKNPLEAHQKKFVEISKYVQPPKFKKNFESLSEFQKKKK